MYWVWGHPKAHDGTLDVRYAVVPQYHETLSDYE